MRRFHRIAEVIKWAGAPEGSKPLAAVLERESPLVELLALLEVTNPCRQVYFAAHDAMAVTYELKLDLLSFRTHSLKLPTRILGLPISLSRDGILAVDEAAGQNLARRILAESPGLTVALNLASPLDGPCQTLSNFVLDLPWASFDEYLAQLRSSYRRNARAVLRAGAGLRFREITPQEFSPAHHDLYLSVLARSKYPLETLSLEFFRKSGCELIEVTDPADRLQAMLVLRGQGDTLHFMFCGFRPDDELLLYHNLLLYIIRRGIAGGYQRIDLGQTSEEAKLRLGGIEERRYLTIHHANPLLRALIQPLARRLSYAGPATSHHVFHPDISSGPKDPDRSKKSKLKDLTEISPGEIAQ